MFKYATELIDERVEWKLGYPASNGLIRVFCHSYPFWPPAVMISRAKFPRYCQSPLPEPLTLHPNLSTAKHFAQLGVALIEIRCLRDFESCFGCTYEVSCRIENSRQSHDEKQNRYDFYSFAPTRFMHRKASASIFELTPDFVFRFDEPQYASSGERQIEAEADGLRSADRTSMFVCSRSPSRTICS